MAPCPGITSWLTLPSIAILDQKRIKPASLPAFMIGK